MDRYSIHLRKPPKPPQTPVEEVQEMIQKWDAGEAIQSILMSEASMIYELIIQRSMIEICRMALAKNLINPVSYTENVENCKAMWKTLNKTQPNVISDDHFEQAIKLARCFLAMGPKETMAIFKKSDPKNFINRHTILLNTPATKLPSAFITDVIYNKNIQPARPMLVTEPEGEPYPTLREAAQPMRLQMNMGYMPPSGHQIMDPRPYITQENATTSSSEAPIPDPDWPRE
jgi:hypothetical protein